MNFITKAVLTTTFVVSAFTVSAFTVSAFAADTKLNFHVDFPFQVGKMTMPAGDYAVSANGSLNSIQIQNVKAKGSAFVTLPTQSTAKVDRPASIDFRCVESSCSIVSVANLVSGVRNSAWSVKDQGAKATLISIRLKPQVTPAD
jgi:hypothetical protein